MKTCKHKWEARNPFIIKRNEKEYPRMCYICKRCGVAVHKHIYSEEQLKRLDFQMKIELRKR